MPNLILIVEDNPLAVKSWSRKFRMKNYEVVSTDNVEEAKALFDKNASLLAGIIMDACVPGHKPTTLGLVRHIRLTYKGHMVAASSIDEYRKLLVAAGCDLSGDKLEAPEILLEAFTSDEQS